ncbi:MAG: hypothetical protein C0485_10080 [Pirellula sp.]|nr:hypothetical protein [Pirellula sp.]
MDGAHGFLRFLVAVGWQRLSVMISIFHWPVYGLASALVQFRLFSLIRDYLGSGGDCQRMAVGGEPANHANGRE